MDRQRSSVGEVLTDWAVGKTLADWYFDVPVPGTDIVATVPWNVPPEHPDQDHPVSVYSGSVQPDPSKTVRFVTLPTNHLHIFALSIGGS
jgi:hypothetical protein